MANLENNNDSKNKKSISDKVQKLDQKDKAEVNNNTKEAEELASDTVHEPVKNVKTSRQQAAKKVTKIKRWAKLLLILFWSSLLFTALFLVVINLPLTKNYLAQKVINLLNNDFKTEITTDKVNINFFGDLSIEDLKIKDFKGKEFITVKKLNANSDWLALIKNAAGGSNSLSFRSIKLEEANIKIITYKNDSIPNFFRYIELFDNGKPKDPNKPPFQIKTRLELINSKLSIVNLNKNGEEGRWLNAEHVNLIAQEFKVQGPDIFAKIKNLSLVTERFGKKHTIDTFSSDFSFTKKAITSKDFTFYTDHSFLQGDIDMTLNPKTGMEDFTNKVKLNVKLKQGSQLSGYDISYFLTSWDNYSPIKVSGNFLGTLNNLELNNLALGNNDVHLSSPKIHMKDLLNGSFLIATDQLSTDFTYVDLKKMMPSFVVAKMKNIADDFGRIKLKGSTSITPSDIHVKEASLITGIGNATIKRFHLSEFSTDIPKYEGDIELHQLNTAAITKSKEVGGLLGGHFIVKGQSFDVNKMVLDTQSEISSIEIMDKNIHQLKLNGVLDHRKYTGTITVSDPQVSADLKGLIDFSTKKIKADLHANIDYLNVAYFTGGKERQIVKGNFEGKLSMSDINNLMIDGRLNDIHYASNEQNLDLDHAQLKTYVENDYRVIDIDAPKLVQGKLEGKFKLNHLMGMVQNGVNSILVGYAPQKLYKGENFNVNLLLSQGLASIALPGLKIPQGAQIDGSYDGNANHLILNVESDEIINISTKSKNSVSEKINEKLAEYSSSKLNTDKFVKDSLLVKGLYVQINTANPEDQISVDLDRIVSGTTLFKDIHLSGNNENNEVLHFKANFLQGTLEAEKNKSLNTYAVNFNQSTNAQGDYVFRFEPTQLTFNKVAWVIDTEPSLDHSITFKKKTSEIIVKNLRIHSDKSEVYIGNAYYKNSKDFHLDGEVKDFNIAKIFEMQPNTGNTMAIEGLANGNFKIQKNKNALIPLIDLKVEDLKMGGKDMGKIVINAKNSDELNVYDLEAKIVANGIFKTDKLSITGTIDNNTPSPTLDVKTEMNDFDISFAQQFISEVFSNIRGKLNGTLDISGPLNNIDYNGDIAISKLGLKLNFTGVDYSFEDSVIPLSKGFALLNNIKLKDGRSNSSGSISGFIQFETLSSLGVNLLMRSNNLTLLDTMQKDNDLFWGKIYGTGDLYVSGPVSALVISTPNLKTLNNSVFTFNSSSTSSVEEFKMLRFLERDNEGDIVLEKKKKVGPNMDIDFSLSMDKGTTVNVLIGESVGDITVLGNSQSLRFKMTKSGVISMEGDYEVENGTFVSKSVMEKTFQITKGSSIKWDGNAMTPQLNIEANYNRTVTNLGAYLGTSALPPVETVLTVALTGTLNNPSIDFMINVPDISSQVKESLATKLMNEDEKIIQFGSILIMSNFNVTDAGGYNLDSQSIESSGYSMLFKKLGSVINTMSNQIQVDLDYLKGDDAANTSDRANASVSIAVSPRVNIKTGLGVPISKKNTTNEYLSGEGTIEYDWSKKNDGTRLFRIYSKPSNIGLIVGSGTENSNQTYGVGVVYSKSFSHLFRRKKNKKFNKENPLKEANSTHLSQDSVRINRDTLQVNE